MADTHEAPPERLWHYTSGSAARSIFQNKALWAGHLGYMNDSSEVNLAMNLSRPIVGEFSSEFPHLKEAFDRWSNYVLDRPPGSWAPNTFAVSFSEERDLLSQWRGYATGPGGPFSIGFPTSTLMDRLNAGSLTWSLRRCLYDRTDQEALIRSQVRTMLLHLSDKTNEAPETYPWRTPWEAIRSAVMSVAPLCKDHGFREEREWRLVAGPLKPEQHQPVHFVDRRHTMAPYIEFPLADDEPLGNIQWIAGPGPEQARANSALGLVARIAGIPDYVGHNSEIPYLP